MLMGYGTWIALSLCLRLAARRQACGLLALNPINQFRFSTAKESPHSKERQFVAQVIDPGPALRITEEKFGNLIGAHQKVITNLSALLGQRATLPKLQGRIGDSQLRRKRGNYLPC